MYLIGCQDDLMGLALGTIIEVGGQKKMTNLEQYAKERDKALLSFDIKKMKKLCRKWEIVMPDNDVVLYAGMMKAICELNKATPEQKARAQEWLTKNKFKVGFDE